MLELNGAADKCKESIVRTDTYVHSGMNLSSALSNDDVTSDNRLSVCLLNTKTLGLGITAVLGRTNALLVGEEL
jgi:hypothetical protein